MIVRTDENTGIHWVTIWNESKRFRDGDEVFVPGNSIFSGHLWIFHSTDYLGNAYLERKIPDGSLGEMICIPENWLEFAIKDTQ